MCLSFATIPNVSHISSNLLKMYTKPFLQNFRGNEIDRTSLLKILRQAGPGKYFLQEKHTHSRQRGEGARVTDLRHSLGYTLLSLCFVLQDFVSTLSALEGYLGRTRFAWKRGALRCPLQLATISNLFWTRDIGWFWGAVFFFWSWLEMSSFGVVCDCF